MNNIKIDTIPPNRWQEYKELYLEALKESPHAFSHTLEEKTATTDDEWKKAIQEGCNEDSCLYFAELDGKLVGMIGFDKHKLTKLRHNAFLKTLFVLESYRGEGIGKMLIQKVLEKLTEDQEIKNIFTEIISTQTASIELHKKFGFEVVGELKDLFLIDGKYYSEYFLEKVIK